MTRVLIDTSLWIEFFSKRSKLSVDAIAIFSELIINDEVAIIEPIRAEILSGHIVASSKSEIVEALNLLHIIDVDWREREIWDEIIKLAEIARKARLPIPGLVDRMIIMSALRADAKLATLDKSLLSLAKKATVRIFDFSGECTP